MDTMRLDEHIAPVFVQGVVGNENDKVTNETNGDFPKSTSRMQGHYTCSVKDKPFYCQSSVSKRPSAATFEPYGNGLSVYKLSQIVLSLSLLFFFSSPPSHPPQHYIWLMFGCLFETTIAATKGRLQHVKGSHFRV